jgi:hypothetical protein
MSKRLLAVLLSALALAAGCDAPDTLNGPFTTPAMMGKGIVYVLPGVFGMEHHYLNIRRGLQGSGIECAIKIHPWGCQIPGFCALVNQTSIFDDRQWGQQVAEEIIAYQKRHPGRPVYLLGQSAGCAISVFACEALAEAKVPPVDGVILLDASLSSTYDLSTALAQSRKGIVSFYNLDDVRMLKVGTDIFGNVDGGHGDSAGRTGFDREYPKLYQVQVTQDMVAAFADPHYADTSAAFTGRYIAPWIIGRTWPALAAGGR